MGRQSSRGMVTVELAIGLVGLAFVTVILASLFNVGAGYHTCAVAATEVARQLARGDVAAAQRVQDALPASSKVSVRNVDDGIEVKVAMRVSVVALAPIDVAADAWAKREVGAG